MIWAWSRGLVSSREGQQVRVSGPCGKSWGGPCVCACKPSKDSEWERMVKPKAEFVNCKCNWGLFRDRNITMRKPVRIHTGEDDMTKKGVVLKYDGKKTLDWWKKGSVCDKVKGQDSSTLPPNLNEDMTLEIYIALMCRTINLKYEKDMEHAGIRTLRFIPPPNAMGQ